MALTSNINAQTEKLPASPTPGWYTLDDEIVIVRAEQWFTTDAHGQATAGGRYATRGAAGSTKASHTAGTALVAYDPDAASTGGGAVTPAAFVAQVADPTEATGEDVAIAFNALQAALIAADLMESS